MEPAAIYGPYGAIVCLMFGIVYLYREWRGCRAENKELVKSSMDLLKKYQERDDEERRWRVEEERRRQERK